MDKEALVNGKVSDGEKLLRTLDNDKLDIEFASWVYYGDSDAWRLVLSSSNEQLNVKKSHLAAYRVIAENLHKIKPENLQISDIKIESLESPLVKGLSSYLSTPKDAVMQVRASGNWLNGIYIEDALIHRAALH